MTEAFFYNEKHERTRKNFMEVAFSVRMCRAYHEIFSCPLVSLVVKKLSPSFTDALHHMRKVRPDQTSTVPKYLYFKEHPIP